MSRRVRLHPSRRQFIRGLAGGTLIAPAALSIPAIIGTEAAAQQNQIVFLGFGGSYQEGQAKAFFEPFEKETGIKVVQTTGVDLAKIKAQVEAGAVQYDLISLPDRLRYTAATGGLLEPLDYSVINKADIIPELVQPHSVGGVTIPMLLTYSTKAFPPEKAPKTWKDFWNTKDFPGPRSLFNTPPYSLEFALIADDVPRDKLYPLDIDRAFRSLDRIKKDVRVWWTQGPQPGLILKNGEVVMVAWTRSLSFVLEGEPLGVSYDGAALTHESWVVPKGSKNARNAMRFIDFALRPRPQAELTKYIAFGPTNKHANQFVDPRVLAVLSSNPDNASKGFLLNGDWWGPNLEKITERWNEWRLRG